MRFRDRNFITTEFIRALEYLGEESPEWVDFQRVRMLKGEGVALTIDDASGTRPTMGLCQTWELLGITLL